MSFAVPVVVSVSDKYLWCLKPFSYFFNKYWGSNHMVIVQGYSRPDFKLPDNFTFISVDNFNYPREKWVDGFLKFLYMPESNMSIFSHFILLLEDYWLLRLINSESLYDIVEFCMVKEPDTLRFDLTADRLYAGGMRDYEPYKSLDIIHAPKSPYEMSLQAALWNKELFADVLKNLPDSLHSAWDVELEGNRIVMDKSYKVYGSRQWPVRYVNGMNNSVPGINMNGFTNEDKCIVLDFARQMGVSNE